MDNESIQTFWMGDSSSTDDFTLDMHPMDQIPSHQTDLKNYTEWQKQTKKHNITLTDVNALLMDFLEKKGYASVAKKFAEEAAAKQAGNQHSLHVRDIMRRTVLQNNIVGAISTLNKHYPKILDENLDLNFRLNQQLLIKQIVANRVEEALDIATNKLSVLVQENPDQFKERFEQTMILFAFKSPYNSPSRHLLLAENLVSLAHDCNEAIIKSECGETGTKLELLDQFKDYAEQEFREYFIDGFLPPESLYDL